MKKKKDDKKALPKFETATLSDADLRQATGGMMPCTGGTRSVCHIDGSDDSDYPF
jgi:hypothetical protein